MDKRTDRLEWGALLTGLLLFTAVLVVPTLQERSAIIQRESSRLTSATQVIAQNLSRTLLGTKQALADVRDELEFLRNRPDWRQPIAKQLRALSNAMTGVRSMLVIDANGQALAMGAMDGVTLPANINASDMLYFQNVRSKPDAATLYVSAPYVTKAGAWTFNLARALITPEGNFDGLIVAVMDLEDTQLMLASTRYTDDQFAALIHGRGLQIIIEPANRGEAGRNVAVPGSFFSRHLASGETASVFQDLTPNAQGSDGERLAALRTVQPPMMQMDQPLVIVAGRNMDAMLQAWRSALHGRMVMLGVVWAMGLLSLGMLQRSRRIAAAKVSAQTRQIDQIFESFLNLLAITDFDGRVIRLSAAWGKHMGWPVQQLIGQSIIEQYGHPDDLQAFQTVQDRLRESGELQDYRCRVRDAGGTYHDFVVQLSLLQGWCYVDAHDVTQTVQQQRAVEDLNAQLQTTNAQLVAKEAQLVQLAQSDGLTQLANRRYFDERLVTELRQCAREARPLSVAMIDVDHFKKYNDRYGHLAGDACLQQVAQAMRAHIGRAHDLVARYGGEEFVVLLPGIDVRGAADVAEKIRMAVEGLGRPHEDSPTAPVVTVSIGLHVLVPDGGTTPEAVLSAADQALYRAKSEGRNRVVQG